MTSIIAKRKVEYVKGPNNRERAMSQHGQVDGLNAPDWPGGLPESIGDSINTIAADLTQIKDDIANIGPGGNLTGTPNKAVFFDNAGDAGEYSPLSINPDNGVDLFQTVAPAATGNYIKHNNQYLQVTPSVDSNEHWYAQWHEPRIQASAFEMGDPVTGTGGLNGIGMAMTAEGDFGYIRNFDYSIQVGDGVNPISGHTAAALNQYINVASGVTLERAYGLPISISSAAGSTIDQVSGYSLNVNTAMITGNLTGFQIGGNATFNGAGTWFNGFAINGNMTGLDSATGIAIDMTNISTAGTKFAINTIGDNYFDGDVTITGALTFGGALSIGQLNAFYATNPVDGGGNPLTLHGMVTGMTGLTGITTANADAIGVNTAMLITNQTNSINTSGPFQLGWTALALPCVVETHTGSTLDYMSGATYALNLAGTSTGGTIDHVRLCRSVVIPNGITTITNSYGFFYHEPFGGVSSRNFGIYMEDAAYNWVESGMKIGGTAGSSDTTAHKLEVEGASLFNGQVGFFNTTPVSQPSSAGAQTATGTWTATEQQMLQDVYDAMRALGLMA
jgi:hypothetical protein